MRAEDLPYLRDHVVAGRTILPGAAFVEMAVSPLTAAVILALVAGYFGGWVDEIGMRVAELFQTIPFFLFAILLVAVLGAGLWVAGGARWCRGSPRASRPRG